MHARKIHAHEMHAHKMHAHKMHAHEVHACKMHVYEVHAHEMHACEIHAYEMQMTPMQIDAPQCLKHEGVLALGGVGKGVVPSHSVRDSGARVLVVSNCLLPFMLALTKLYTQFK